MSGASCYPRPWWERVASASERGEGGAQRDTPRARTLVRGIKKFVRSLPSAAAASWSNRTLSREVPRPKARQERTGTAPT